MMSALKAEPIRHERSIDPGRTGRARDSCPGSVSMVSKKRRRQ